MSAGSESQAMGRRPLRSWNRGVFKRTLGLRGRVRICWYGTFVVLLIAACLDELSCTRQVTQSFVGQDASSSGPSKLHASTKVARAAAKLDRDAALDLLGLGGGGVYPSDSELKRAYRKAVLKAHPDSPGGTPEKLRNVQDAYDLLIGSPPSKGPRAREPGPDRDPFEGYYQPRPATPPTREEEEEKKEAAERRQVVLAFASLGAVALLLILLNFTVSRAPRDVEVKLGNAPLPAGSKAALVRIGQEYVMAAQQVDRNRCKLLLLGDSLPGQIGGMSIGAARMSLAQEGDVERRQLALDRHLQISEDLKALLDEPQQSQNEEFLKGSAKYPRRYGSVTMVLAQPDLSAVAVLLRGLYDEPQYPYTIVSGDAVVRFTSGDTGQELILSPAQSIMRRNDEFDAGAVAALARECPPDLLVFDLTRDLWENYVEGPSVASIRLQDPAELVKLSAVPPLKAKEVTVKALALIPKGQDPWGD
eukprot:TRINITY_DN42122_c0_g1_i1.p1 TRINITY_DN42122_c0_g1~~TRINITY_DN42122_c0_g1_i1.p1  ORF type:complete len:490 (-),score=84.73 TRINITY_DN42122_c0_g1_i1:9-1436(-)